MKEIIIQSSRTVNADIILVLMVGVCNIRIFSEVMTWFSIVGIVISVVIGIVVFGRITARVRGIDCLPSGIILKEYWLNYLLVTFVLAIPAILFSQIAKLFTFSPTSFLLTKEGLEVLVQIVTIYVLPIVFLKNESVIAIITGVIYFFKRIKKSLPIIGIVAVIFVINIAVLLRAIDVMPIEPNMQTLVPIMVIINVIFSYLAFLAFAAAAIVLAEGDSSA